MRTKAAVLYHVNDQLQIEDLELEEPKAGEVLVRLVATSVCHTDLHPMKGDIPVPLPIVLGHEGAGVVEQVGPGASRLTQGDHVVLVGSPTCGKCRPCLTGHPYACDMRLVRNFGGMMPDGTKRLRKDGQAVSHFFCQSSFSEYAVVAESIAIRIRDDAPLDRICGFGCGLATGLGAVINKANVRAGSSVSIFGCGGVGLSALIGAKLSGAATIIVVDILDQKLGLARELGATHTINASRESPVDRIKEITGGGADYAFECIGNAQTYSQVLESIRPLGMAVVLGSSPLGSKVALDPLALLVERTITGCIAGNVRPALDIPLWVDLYMQGLLPFGRLLSRTYPLSHINNAIEDMEKGAVVKPVITFH
jgi:aryl-alcohol dehydrogenase